MERNSDFCRLNRSMKSKLFTLLSQAYSYTNRLLQKLTLRAWLVPLPPLLRFPPAAVLRLAVAQLVYKMIAVWTSKSVIGSVVPRPDAVC